MADEQIRKIINEVFYKNNEGQGEGPNFIGAKFQDVIDVRGGADPHTLAQFMDNYLDFMTHTTFVYQGDNTPVNPHIGLWIDTSRSNASQIGQTESE